MPKFSDAEKEFIRQKLMQEGERLFVSFGIKKGTSVYGYCGESADEDVAGDG